jgi:peptide/nickel transport system substrate-binding protein
MKAQHKVFVVFSLLIALSMVLAACAQPAATPAEPEQVVITQIVEVPGETTTEIKEVVVTATPLPPTPEPTQAPKAPADTVVLALQQEPDTLHPLIGSMMAKTIVLGAVFVGCVGQDEAANWIALGCEDLSTLENGGTVFVGDEGSPDRHMEMTYKIKDGWRWTDGTPVTAKDATYWWWLQMQPDFEVADRSGIEKLYNVEAVDDKTVKVSFMSETQAKAAVAGTLEPVVTEFGNVDFAALKDDYASWYSGSGPVVDPVYWSYIGWEPSHVLKDIKPADQAASDFAKKPLGDGPYEVMEWKQGQEIDLVKSAQPFPLGDAKINNIVFRFFAETAGVLAALQNGEIDAVTGTGGLTVNNAPDLDKIEEAGLYDVLYQPGYQWEHIDINTKKEGSPLQDVKVRKALYHAIDKQALVDKLYYGKQSTTDLPVPEGLSWAYTDTYTKYEYDPEKAKALLAEAGWDCAALPCVNADGEQLSFTLYTTDRADRQALAQVIQQMWKAINVGVNLQFLYGRGLFATAEAGGPLNNHTFDAAIYTWITGDDPQLYGLYGCSGGQNYPQWCNEEADVLLQQNESDPVISLSRELRKPVLDEFFKIWTDEVPVIPLFANTRVYVVRTGFENWKAGPTNAAPDTWNSWEWALEK